MKLNENKFTNKMKKCSFQELYDIVHSKEGDYHTEAMNAAKIELEFREQNPELYVEKDVDKTNESKSENYNELNFCVLFLRFSSRIFLFLGILSSFIFLMNSDNSEDFNWKPILIFLSIIFSSGITYSFLYIVSMLGENGINNKK